MRVRSSGALALCASAGAVTLEPDRGGDLLGADIRHLRPARPRPAVRHRAAGDDRRTTPAGTSLFLDLTDKVLDGGEQGLWSIAFAPDFAQTGLFYVAYSADGHRGASPSTSTRAEATPDATEATRREVLAIGNSFASSNHNGGQLQFGPDDYLYWSVGEDGTAPTPRT